MTTLFCAINTRATVILVENVNDSGVGSFRAAVAEASPSANDTILINVRGTMDISSPIEFDSFTALTVIGPYAKHLRITAAGTWIGSLFNISNSEGIIIKNLGFDSGNGNTRHVTIDDCPDVILFERCIFQNNNYTISGGNGAAAIIINSSAKFNQCSFTDNQADNGGAMFISGSSAAVIENCTFSGNFASSNAGALSVTNTSTADLFYSTFVQNSSSGSIQAIRSAGGTTIRIENIAIGDNGSGRQVRFLGDFTNTGGNCIRLNDVSESTFTLHPTDLESTTLIMGLRSTILEDGYGLKYWPIVNSSSDLINPAVVSGLTPTVDCRNAPRSLKGSSAVNVYPDAGACEYTHLRVTNNSGNKGVANSFLWTLEEAQQKDATHYVEFDMSSPTNIVFEDEGIVNGAVYIIDGFSQSGSATPGPHEALTPDLTGAILTVNFLNGGGHDHGIRFDEDAAGSILQGVSVQGFEIHGVEPNISENISIFGCEIGIDEFGIENGNASAGIRINSSGNTIGGWEHWMRNVISGNGLPGTDESNIYISYLNNSNVIQGNIIGGSANGMGGIGAVSTTPYGIYVASALNVIGGTLPNSGNIIVDNEYGTYHFRTGDFTTYSGNLIGLAYDKSTALGNSIAGISLQGCDDNLIGGFSSRSQNYIAHNGVGIEIALETTTAEKNTILGNSIHSNTNQGIDINGDGAVLANDGIFDGSHSNQGIDFPEITESTSCETSSTITIFDLRVPISEDYRVEFFTVTSPDASNGEGEIFIDATTISVTSNPQTIVYDHGFDVGIGLTLSSTVTQISSGNTSEFGTNVLITAPTYDASISYDDICPWDIATPNFDGDTGGEFRFSDPLPLDGATIDVISGEVTGGIESTSYEIVYEFTGICAAKDTAILTVTTINEEFTFPDFCPGEDGLIEAVETPGGVFSFNPDPGDGASITVDDGTITGGIEGTTYTVRYIVDVGACSDTGSVDVSVTSTDESFTMEDFCPEVLSAAADPITPGGAFYFAPPPGGDVTIDILTGAITGGIEYSTYMLRYVVGACAEEDTISVSVIGVEEGFTYTDFCAGTTGFPSEIIVPGGFSFFTEPGDGAIINPGTGNITFGTEGTTYEILHTVGICNDTALETATMIEVLEDFTFPDFCEVNDSSAIVPTADDPLNSNYILLGPDDGATIDPFTGRIYNPNEGTTYTVIDSVWTSGCWQIDTNEVLTILVDEYFEYTNICVDGSGFPSDVELDGIFSIIDDPGDGVIIDEASGELSGGLVGTTYTVRYIKDTGLCADTLEQEVLFIEVDASFVFPDFCPGLNPSPAPIPSFFGGEYDFTTPPLDGETINSSTGQIIDPVEGNTYSITYVYVDPEAGCTDTKIESVNVKVVNEEVFYDDFCWESTSGPAELLEDGGILTFGTPAPVDGETLDADGIIYGATEGTIYEIVHTLTIDGCEQSDSTFVTALGIDESFIFDDYCWSNESPAPTAATGGGTYELLGIIPPGVSIDASSGVITGGIEGESYTVMHSVPYGEGCNESDIDIVNVLGSDESFSMDNFCAAFPSDLPMPMVGGGVYAFEPDPDLGDDAVIDPETGIITLAEHGTTYGVKYTLLIDGCSDVDTILVQAYASEEAAFTVDSYCANIETPIEILGTEGGAFSLDPDPAPDGATIDPTSGTFTSSVGGVYDVTYITPGSEITCADTITESITLYDVPSILDITSENDFYCADNELSPLVVSSYFAASQIYWYIEDIGGTINDSSFTYNPLNITPGNNTFYAQPKSDDGCIGEFASYIIYLSDTSGMEAIADFEICLGSPAQLIAYGGASYLWHTEIPLADYTVNNPTAFSLNEEVYTVSIFNEDGCEVIDTVNVTFSERSECVVDTYNAFSPNNDGKNDYWYIDNLINFIPNTVYIYSRWGDELQMISDYDNITTYWDGTDTGGNELPPNTYFYVVITEGTDQSQAGWVQLVR